MKYLPLKPVKTDDKCDVEDVVLSSSVDITEGFDLTEVVDVTEGPDLIEVVDVKDDRASK